MKVKEKATSSQDSLSKTQSLDSVPRTGSHCRQAAACNVRVIAMATEGQCVSTNVRPKTKRLIACPHDDIPSPIPPPAFSFESLQSTYDTCQNYHGFHPPVLDDLVHAQAHASANR